MSKYEWLGRFLREKPVEHWNSLGKYTILLEGLHTPVLVNMDGTGVLSVSAFGQTYELGDAGLPSDYYDGYSPVVYIRSTEDAVVIRYGNGEDDDSSILITKDKIFDYTNLKEEDDSGFILLWVDDDGTLAYQEIWIDPKIEIMGRHMLYYPTSRDMVMYQEGHAEIEDGEVVYTPEATVLVSDYFDLDSIFAEAKAAGWFEEYETVDELFEANKNNMQ